MFDPAPYVHGWHLEAIADHLEAVTRGQIRKLLITMPPRHSKTLLTSVVWPAWTWCQEQIEGLPLIGPQTKFLCLSYSDMLSTDSATSMRRLVQSPWYQKRWGHRVKLAADQEGKHKFDTTAGGTRISVSFQGTVTGRGGDIKIIDDPIKPEEAESELTRDKVLRLYDGTLKSRITDPRNNAEVVIMQRLAELDLAGHILSTDPDFEHLMLPAEFEPSRRYHTCLDWTDPRTEDGELLWPERFGPKELAQYKRNPHEWSGQWQQSPTPRGGGMFKDEWWKPFLADKSVHGNDGRMPSCSYVVVSLDPAYTEKKQNDPSGCVTLGVWYEDGDPNARIIVMDSWSKHLEIQGHRELVERKPSETLADWVNRTRQDWGLVEWVAYTCERFRGASRDGNLKLLIEGKASGISVEQLMRKTYAGKGWSIQMCDPKGADKIARAYAVQDMFAEGMVYVPVYANAKDGQGRPYLDRNAPLLHRDWSSDLIWEMATFPRGVHDDRVDAISQALRHIRKIGMAVRKDEADLMRQELMRHRGGKTSALYEG